MRKESLKFLERLLEAPSPSGYEQPAQIVYRDYTSAFADEVYSDVHGNVVAVINKDAPFKLMLAGHCDEVGLMVKHVDDNGFIRVAMIGGVEPIVIVGMRYWIHSEKGPVLAVAGRRPIHLARGEKDSDMPKIHQLWLDIGAKDKDDALKMISIGDPITPAVTMARLPNDRITCRGLDDKIGSFVVAEALRLAKEKEVKIGVYAVSTVQEEVGLRGARTSTFGIAPQVGIAVDVDHASDCPEIDKSRTGEIKLGEGPVLYRGSNINPVLGKILIDQAKKKKIPHQVSGSPGATGTDANAIQLTRAGVATGLIGIPNRYMHSPVEMVSLKDAENAAKLIAAVAGVISEETDFRPV